jgi:hypothetical protein
MDHPLKNKDCLYYELYTGMESIDVLEKVFTQFNSGRLFGIGIAYI